MNTIATTAAVIARLPSPKDALAGEGTDDPASAPGAEVTKARGRSTARPLLAFNRKL